MEGKEIKKKWNKEGKDGGREEGRREREGWKGRGREEGREKMR